LFLALFLVSVALVSGIVEARRLNAKATALLAEVVAIKPNQSTEDLRQRWKREFSTYYSESNEHSFGVNLHNAALARWHIVKGAMLGVDVFGDPTRITDLDLLYYSSNAKAPAGVTWHQSLVETSNAKACTLRLKHTNVGTPWRAYLNFQYQNRPPGMFNVRLSCLSSFRGCEAPEVLLPTLPDLQSLCTEVEYPTRGSAR
jgi:hypothetical protein